MKFTVAEIARILDVPTPPAVDPTRLIASLNVDSRLCDSASAFVALRGQNTDGAKFVEDALNKGAILALCAKHSRETVARAVRDRVLWVEDPVLAMQQISRAWRKKLACPVLAITGSNGKTIVKDMLSRFVAGRHAHVYTSPASFNSRVGISLSLARAPVESELLIQEVGVPDLGEMRSVRLALDPAFGILTNLGLAHIGRFGTREALLEEKLELFAELPRDNWLLAPDDEFVLSFARSRLKCRILPIGCAEIPKLEAIETLATGSTRVVFKLDGRELISTIAPFSAAPLLQDLEIAVAAAFLLDVSPQVIQDRIAELCIAPTRLEVWRSPQQITLVNDAVSADPLSVGVALGYAASLGEPGAGKTFIFGGMREMGLRQRQAFAEVGASAARNGYTRLILVEDEFTLDDTAESFRELAPAQAEIIRCKSESLASHLRSGTPPRSVVLFKGPQGTRISAVARDFLDGIAPTTFTLSRRAVRENIARFRRHCGGPLVMAMVKALAYGTEAARLAAVVAELGVDWLGVANADEGIEIRRAGVETPILVLMMAPDESSKLIEHRLTPLVYARHLLGPLAQAAQRNGIRLDVHLAIDTGMHREGVLPREASDVVREILAEKHLRLTGLMTHFSCADDPRADEVTKSQAAIFEQVHAELRKAGLPSLLRHAAATSAAARFPEYAYDMIRVGIGLYGIAPSESVAEALPLELAVTLVSHIIDIRQLSPGDCVGYGRAFTVGPKPIQAGILPIGYNDGLPWSLGNRGVVLIGAVECPIIGRVSMDSITVDLSGVPNPAIGMEALIYGQRDGFELRPERQAALAATLPYELLVRIGRRVQRVFV